MTADSASNQSRHVGYTVNEGSFQVNGRHAASGKLCFLPVQVTFHQCLILAKRSSDPITQTFLEACCI